MITASVNVDEFNKSFTRYKLDLDLEIQPALKEQTRLLLKTVEELLPPAKRAQGVKAIRKDISKQFIDEQWLASGFNLHNAKLAERIKGYLKTHDYDAIKQIARDTGIFNNFRVQEFSENDIKRNNRGRIIQSGTKILPLNRTPLVEYRKSLEEHVGKLRAWCKNGYLKLGGKLPAWISKQEGKGYFVDVSGNPSKPFIELGTFLDYAKDVNSRYNVTQRAVDIRAKAMLLSIEKGLNAAQKKFYNKSR